MLPRIFHDVFLFLFLIAWKSLIFQSHTGVNGRIHGIFQAVQFQSVYSLSVSKSTFLKAYFQFLSKK